MGIAQRVERLANRLREEGRQEGQTTGMRLGELKILQRLLEAKFGPLSPAIVDRLERAEVDCLLLWGERLLEAKTLDEVFAD